MPLLVDRPDHFMCQWVLLGSIPTNKFFERLQKAEFRPTKKGMYQQTIDSTTYTVQPQVSKESLRFHLFYANYDGSPEMGKEITDFMAQQVGLTIRSFECFLPDRSKKGGQMFEEAGFEGATQQTNPQAELYLFGEVSLIVVEEGYLLQIRGQHTRDWNRLYKQLFQALERLEQARELNKRKKLSQAV